MARFEDEQPALGVPGLPTPTAQDHDNARPADVEAAQPKSGFHWLRASKKPSGGSKTEKSEDMDYVEEVDGVWGKLGEGTPNYKNVSW